MDCNRGGRVPRFEPTLSPDHLRKLAAGTGRGPNGGVPRRLPLPGAHSGKEASSGLTLPIIWTIPIWKDRQDTAYFAHFAHFFSIVTRYFLTALAATLLAMATGCHAIDFYTPSLQKQTPPELTPPRELSMISLPAYRIAPPDVIGIQAIRLIPTTSYRIEPDDILLIHVMGTLRNQPIDKQFPVERDGSVILGGPYGSVRVVGDTVEEAEAEITRMLKMILSQPTVSVKLTRSAVADQFRQPLTVQPDGTVNLRGCGMVYLAGKTVTEARGDARTPHSVFRLAAGRRRHSQLQ